MPLAGKSNLQFGTRIRTTKQWDRDNHEIITGEITHPLGCFGGSDHGAIAGIRIDNEF